MDISLLQRSGCDDEADDNNKEKSKAIGCVFGIGAVFDGAQKR